MSAPAVSDAKRSDLVEWESAASETGGQRLTLHEFHDQEVDAFVLADIMERADVRVVQAGDHSGFAFEPLARLRAVQNPVRQHLHRNSSVEPNITGPIDLTHAARAERGLDLVPAQASTRDNGHAKAGL